MGHISAKRLGTVGQTANGLWKTGTEAQRMTEMKFGVQGTKRPSNRDDEGDPKPGK